MIGRTLCAIALSILFVFGNTSAIGSKTSFVIDTFDLAGIPAPYNFYKFQELPTGVRLRVGGDGEFGYIPNLGPVYRGKVADLDLNGVHFVNSKQGWVVGTQGGIFRTEDAGRTWAKQRSGVKSELLAITCPGEAKCWITGEDGVILKTNNGRDWTQVKSGVNHDLTAVDFLNESTGIVVGPRALILRTDDGGTTWKQQPIRGGELTCNGHPFASDSPKLLAVTILDSNTAWVAGGGGVASYSSSSSSWGGICLEHVARPIGVVSQNGKDVFAIGSWGENAVSRDSGKTWTRYDPSQNN